MEEICSFCQHNHLIQTWAGTPYALDPINVPFDGGVTLVADLRLLQKEALFYATNSLAKAGLFEDFKAQFTKTTP